MSGSETRDAEALARETESLREQLRVISDVLHAVASSEGLQGVLDAVIEGAARLCDGEYAALYLTDGHLLRARSHFINEKGRSAVAGGGSVQWELDERQPHVPDRTTIAGRVAVTGDAVLIPDLVADPEYSFPLAGGSRAGLGAPVRVDDDLIGVIVIVRDLVKPFQTDDLELVRTFATQAAIAIANARLIDAVERQRSELSRFVSPQVAELLTSEDGKKLLAGHRAYVSFVFCDLRGFTSFAETSAPEELFDVLRDYHEALGKLITQYEGTLEHFAGDGVMVFFNDPVTIDDHELKAVGLALAAQAHFDALAQTWRKRGIELGLGIGIAAGYSTLGRIGFEGRYDYGALGPDTNLASRLSTEAKPGQTLISQRVFAAVDDRVEARPVGELELKGFARPVAAYEVHKLRT